MLVTISTALLAFFGLSATAQPCLSSEFTMTMSYDNQNLSLGAIDSGKTGILNIVGFGADSYRGTPLQLVGNGLNGTANLSFDIKPGVDCKTNQTGTFPLYTADVGEGYGLQVPITAELGVEWPHWFVGNGIVSPQQTAASQTTYACPITIRGQQYMGLSWGVYNENGSFPYLCTPTTVYYRYNLPCSG